MTLSMTFKIDVSKEIGLQLEESVLFPFLKIGFSFVTLEAIGKTPCEIERFQSAEMGFANMFAPSSKNLPESLSTPAALELSIFVIIFKTFSLETLRKQKSFEIVKLEYYLITDCKLYLSGGFGSLIRRDFAKFEIFKNFWDLLCAIGQSIIFFNCIEIRNYRFVWHGQRFKGFP